MFRSTCVLLACLILPSAVSALPSTTATTRRDDIGPLLSRLRDPKLSIGERERLQSQLIALGEDGARALQKQVEEECARTEKHELVQEGRYFNGFGRVADGVVAKRVDKAAQKEVDKLRDEINALNRDENLSKERIHEVGDPRMKRLKELLVVTPDDVSAADAELAPVRQVLLDDIDELDRQFEVWTKCNDALPEKRRSKALADPAPRYTHLLAQERWLAELATPMSKGDKETLLANREFDAQLDSQEAAGILDLNLLRIHLGLRALAIDPKLCIAARDHSNDMRTLGFFAHESPVEGKRTPMDRAARAGTSAHSENIAGGQSTGAGANEGWWYSPGHHKNMTGDHARVGLGRSETIWTQMFG
jgi:uncharacterized protein YkwD